MSISAEQFLELVNRQKDDQNFEMVNGHRRARRIPCIGTVDFQPLTGTDAGRKWTVRLRDISARGLAVLDKWTAPKGSQFIISLPRQAGRPLRILCTVSYNARLPGNLFRTGAEIAGILPDAITPAAKAPERAKPAVPVAANDVDEAERIRQRILE